jgi:type I restriction enzyme M protein
MELPDSAGGHTEQHMSTDTPTALIVPQGKLVDFIDGTIRDETPEEYVRQEIEKSLVREYLYPREEIAVEFSVKMGRLRKRVDLVIFPEATAHKPEYAWAILECKSADVSPNDRSEGIEQLKSYMAACVNAEFGMWTNGQERFCFRKIASGRAYDFIEIVDLPAKGKDIDDAEKPTIASLKVATSDALLFMFRRCHNYIAGNQGLQKPEAFWELLKLIFCKIEDERSEELQFYSTTQERQSLSGQLKIKSRIEKIFSEVCNKYLSIFRSNDTIDLQPRVLSYIISQLQVYSLLDSDIDVKGRAYEELVGSNLRGDRGEFFTPRNICKMAVAMADPNYNQLIVDPACGTGGFLITAMNHVVSKIRESERKRWRNQQAPSEREQLELFRKIQEYADNKIVGIDLNPQSSQGSKNEYGDEQ